MVHVTGRLLTTSPWQGVIRGGSALDITRKRVWIWKPDRNGFDLAPVALRRQLFRCICWCWSWNNIRW